DLPSFAVCAPEFEDAIEMAADLVPGIEVHSGEADIDDVLVGVVPLNRRRLGGRLHPRPSFPPRRRCPRHYRESNAVGAPATIASCAGCSCVFSPKMQSRAVAATRRSWSE